MGSEAGHDLLSGSDLIITVGLDVVELFEPGTWLYPQRVVNIDSVPHLDGLFHPIQELLVDIGTNLDVLTSSLSSGGG